MTTMGDSAALASNVSKPYSFGILAASEPLRVNNSDVSGAEKKQPMLFSIVPPGSRATGSAGVGVTRSVADPCIGATPVIVSTK